MQEAASKSWEFSTSGSENAKQGTLLYSQGWNWSCNQGLDKDWGSSICRVSEWQVIVPTLLQFAADVYVSAVESSFLWRPGCQSDLLYVPIFNVHFHEVHSQLLTKDVTD